VNIYDLLEEAEEWRRSVGDRLTDTATTNGLTSAKRRGDAEALVKGEMAEEYEQRIEDALKRLRNSEEE
jgi:hypothetical protein